MTLIPMMSAIAATPRRAIEPVAGSSLAHGGYNPGAGHRPIAAAFAIGLPVALVVAVALSPMVTIITHKDPPIIVEPVDDDGYPGLEPPSQVHVSCGHTVAGVEVGHVHRCIMVLSRGQRLPDGPLDRLDDEPPQLEPRR